MSRPSKQSRRGYGIAEWLGESIVTMSPARRRELALMQQGGQSEPLPCPPRCHSGAVCHCSKNGGVCSIREYSLDPDGGFTFGPVRTTCPYRFEENGLIFRWIGRELLGTEEPMVLSQIPLLERTGEGASARDVGRIDSILVHPGGEPLDWCAVEVQAVYFSGGNMEMEFSALAESDDQQVPFPVGRRRPDDRSSGPKRLMPQLQMKVPSISRWGKRMAVVVDEGFYENLAVMDSVDDISSGEIVWFVVRYGEGPKGLCLVPGQTHVTTLADSVRGLTAARSVTKQEFEDRIRRRIAESTGPEDQAK